MYQLVDFDTLSVLSEHPSQEEAHEAAVFAQERSPGLRVFVMTPGALHSARRRRGILWDREAAQRARAQEDVVEAVAAARSAALAAAAARRSDESESDDQAPAAEAPLVASDTTPEYDATPSRDRDQAVYVRMDESEIAALDALRRDGESRAACVRRLVAALSPG